MADRDIIVKHVDMTKDYELQYNYLKKYLSVNCAIIINNKKLLICEKHSSFIIYNISKLLYINILSRKNIIDIDEFLDLIPNNEIILINKILKKYLDVIKIFDNIITFNDKLNKSRFTELIKPTVDFIRCGNNFTEIKHCFIIAYYLFKKGKTLPIKTTKNKIKKNVLPGGGFHKGKDRNLFETALREVNEETGLNLYNYNFNITDLLEINVKDRINNKIYPNLIYIIYITDTNNNLENIIKKRFVPSREIKNIKFISLKEDIATEIKNLLKNL